MSIANDILARIGLPEQKEVKAFTLRFYGDGVVKSTTGIANKEQLLAEKLILAIKYADGE